jgi:hypothetical protein
MEYLNYLSYAVQVGVVLLILAAFLFRRGMTRGRLLFLGAVLVGLLGVNLAVRRAPTTLEGVTEVQALFVPGKATLVEFYSDY